MAIAASVFYVISFVLLTVAVFLFPKKDEPTAFFTWAPIHLIVVFCFQGFVGAILAIAHLPATIWTIGVPNLIAAILLWVCIVKFGRQTYRFDGTVCLYMVAVIIAAGVIGIKRFGIELMPHFDSVDGASHLGFAMRYMHEGLPEINLIMPSLLESLWMKVFSPVMGDFMVYKVFLAMEILFFALAGLVFVSLIARFLETIPMKVIGFVFLLFYYLGYPLYTFQFGFAYYGLCITICAFLIFVTREWMYDELNPAVGIVLMALGLMGVFLSYTLLVPPVFLGIFFAILARQKTYNELISKNTVFIMLETFLIPSVVGLLLSARNLIFLGAATNGGVQNGDIVTVGIAEDGGCYNDMYGNFVLLFPFILIGIYVLCQKAHLDEPVLWLSVWMVIFTGGLFLFAMKGIVSVYYYVRTSNLLWLLFVLLLMEAMEYLVEESFITAVASTLLFAVLLTANYTWIDQKILARNERFIQSGVENFVHVHYWTRQFMLTEGFDHRLMDLFEYVHNNTEYMSNECLSVGDPVFSTWVYRSANQKLNTQEWEVEAALKEVTPETKYVIFQYTEESLKYADEWRNAGEVVLETDGGMVIALP